jgi:hypothetical protein
LRTLLQRLNRRLERQDMHIAQSQGRFVNPTTGDYFLVKGGKVAQTHLTVDAIERLAREHKAIKEWEVAAR